MAWKMKHKILCIFIPRFISVAAEITLFSTLAQTNITHLRSPLADFAAARFNLSAADIAHMLKYAPSLNNPKTLLNVERFAHVLAKYGCTEHQIARIMRSQPRILTISAEKLVEPKIELLKDLGIEDKDVPNFLLKAPTYLSTNLQDGILPKITFLKTLFQSQMLLLKALKKKPTILTYSLERHLRPSLAFWEGCGLQGEELARFLSSNPVLLRSTFLAPPKIDLIRNIGICKESKSYKNVLNVVLRSRVETLESKMDCFRQWGLSAEEIWKLFRTYPWVFGLSKDTLREKMEFVVNTMEVPPNSVVKHSAVLKYSLEKVVKPRFIVFQRIKPLNGVEHLKSKQLYTLISMSEADFVNKILKGHPELKELYALHKKAIPKISSGFKVKLFI